MAKTEKDILISLKLDNKDFEKNVDATKKGLESLGKQIQMTQKFLGAAKEGTKQYQQLSETLKNQQAVFEKLNSSINKTDESSKSLKAKLREIKQRLGELDEGSDEFIKLQKEAGELQDKIGDLNARVKTFASDTRNLDAAIEGISVVAAGFGAVQGSMAALGIESESVEKTLTKLAGITTLLNSLQTIQNALQQESAIRLFLSDKAAKIYSATQSFLSKTLNVSSLAAKNLSKALLSTGVGAIVVGIGLVIAYYEDLAKMVGITTDKEKKRSEELKKLKEQTDKIVEDGAKEVGTYLQLSARLTNTNLSYKEKKKIADELNSQFGTTFKNLNDEKQVVEDIKKGYDALIKSIKEKIILEQSQQVLKPLLEQQIQLELGLKTYEDQVSNLTKANEVLQRAIEKGNVVSSESTKKTIEDNKKLIEDSEESVKNFRNKLEENRKQVDSAIEKSGVKLLSSTQSFKDKNEKQVESSLEKIKDFTLKISQEVATANGEILNDGLSKEIETLRISQENKKEQLKKELSDIKATTEQEKNLKEKAKKELEVLLLKIDEETRAKEIAITKKYTDEDIKLVEESYDKIIESIQARSDKRKEFIELEIKDEKKKQKEILKLELDTAKQILQVLEEKANIDGIITKEESKAINDAKDNIDIIDAKLKDINKSDFIIGDKLKEQLDVAIEGITSAIGIINDAISQSFERQNQEIENNSKKQIDSINKSGLTELQKERQIAKVEEENAKKKYQLEVEAFNFNKAMQISQAVINGAQALIAILNSPGDTFGIATGIRTAIAIATTSAQIGIISAQEPPPPPFFKGGYTGDGNPRDVSVQLGKKNYTYHKGEYVVPNRVLMSPDGSKLVNQLESMRTSNSISMGMNGFADGGFTSSQMSSSVQMQMQGQMISSMVTDAIKNVQIVTRVTDINRINKNLAQTKAKATLR